MKWLFLICFSLFHPLNAVVQHLKSLEETEYFGDRERRQAAPRKDQFQYFWRFLYWKASLDGVAYATTAKGICSEHCRWHSNR